MLTKECRICPIIVNLDGAVPSVEVKTELSLVDPLSSAQFGVGYVFHCDGFLLCTFENQSRFVVWNLFTGETRWFQHRKSDARGRVFVLGYDQERNKKSYKVLSFDSYYKIYEIYEFSSDSWMVLDEIISPGWSIGYDWSSRVSLKGSTYLFAEDETKAQLHLSLARFDFATEKVAPVLPLPFQCNDFKATGLSAVKDEKISVLLQQDAISKTEIWVTNKIDETSQMVSKWSKILALDLSRHLQFYGDTTFLLYEEKKVVMICERWFEFESKSKDMISIVGENSEVITQKDFGIDPWDGCVADILNYVPSLAQIERPGGKRQKK